MFIEWLYFPLLQTSLPLNVLIKMSSLSACWLAILKIVHFFPFFFYNPDNVSRWQFVVLSSTVICWCCSTRSSAADWSTSPGGRWWRRWGRPQIETWRSVPLRIPPARKIRRIYKYLHISLGVSFHNPFWRNELNYLFIYSFIFAKSIFWGWKEYNRIPVLINPIRLGPTSIMGIPAKEVWVEKTRLKKQGTINKSTGRGGGGWGGEQRPHRNQSFHLACFLDSALDLRLGVEVKASWG